MLYQHQTMSDYTKELNELYEAQDAAQNLYNEAERLIGSCNEKLKDNKTPELIAELKRGREMMEKAIQMMLDNSDKSLEITKKHRGF